MLVGKRAKTIFYARVSTKDQRLDLQLDAARQLGVKTDNVFVEKASGAKQDRPTLAKALTWRRVTPSPAINSIESGARWRTSASS